MHFHRQCSLQNACPACVLDDCSWRAAQGKWKQPTDSSSNSSGNAAGRTIQAICGCKWSSHNIVEANKKNYIYRQIKTSAIAGMYASSWRREPRKEFLIQFRSWDLHKWGHLAPRMANWEVYFNRHFQTQLSDNLNICGIDQRLVCAAELILENLLCLPVYSCSRKDRCESFVMCHRWHTRTLTRREFVATTLAAMLYITQCQLEYRGNMRFTHLNVVARCDGWPWPLQVSWYPKQFLPSLWV